MHLLSTDIITEGKKKTLKKSILTVNWNAEVDLTSWASQSHRFPSCQFFFNNKAERGPKLYSLAGDKTLLQKLALQLFNIKTPTD